MRIQYIKHSGFLVELPMAVLVFDYYEGQLDVISENKPVYFFASHKHSDHFSFHIFQYAKGVQQVKYILSSDLKMNAKYMDRRGVPEEARASIIYAHKNEIFRIDDCITVETLTSTDQGVAYIVTYEDESLQNPVTIYHAGDLNWWTWEGETELEYKDMERSFKGEIGKIRGRSFDLAFVPLDPRQEERFYWGFDYFMRNTNTKKAFPMHCWEDYSVISKLMVMDESKDYRDRIVRITHCGEMFKQIDEN